MGVAGSEGCLLIHAIASLRRVARAYQEKGTKLITITPHCDQHVAARARQPHVGVECSDPGTLGSSRRKRADSLSKDSSVRCLGSEDAAQWRRDIRLTPQNEASIRTEAATGWENSWCLIFPDCWSELQRYCPSGSLEY